MYLLSRLMLIAAVALAVPCTVLAAILAIQEFFPENQELVWAILIVGMIAVAVRKKGRRIFTSGGTAVWATTAEIQRAGMLDAGTGLSKAWAHWVRSRRRSRRCATRWPPA